jgi:anti-sigma-K factor RskA
MITCEHCREEMAEYALGQTDPAAAAAIEEHLAACVVCRRDLAEVQTAWSALALALPPATPRAEVFDRIAQRIAEADGARPSATESNAAAPPPLTRGLRFASYALAAAVLACLIGGAIYLRTQVRGGAGDLAADQALHDLAQRLGKVQELDQMLNSGNVRLASLYPPNSHRTAGAYVIWDLASRQWHFFAPGLAAAPEGKQYQLWAVVEGKPPIAGPTFPVDEHGLGSVVADLPTLKPGVNVKAVITLEPTGGSPEPTGETVLEAPL